MLLTVSVVTFCHHSGASGWSPGGRFAVARFVGGKLEEIGGARPPDAPLFALPVAKSDEEDPPLGSAVPGYLALSNHSSSLSSCANASPTLCSTKKMLRNPQTVVRSPLEPPPPDGYPTVAGTVCSQVMAPSTCHDQPRPTATGAIVNFGRRTPVLTSSQIQLFGVSSLSLARSHIPTTQGRGEACLSEQKQEEREGETVLGTFYQNAIHATSRRRVLAHARPCP